MRAPHEGAGRVCGIGRAELLIGVGVFSAATSLDDVNACRARLSKIFVEDSRTNTFKYLSEMRIRLSDTIEANKIASLRTERPSLSVAHWFADGDRVSLPFEIRQKWAADPIYA